MFVCTHTCYKTQHCSHPRPPVQIRQRKPETGTKAIKAHTDAGKHGDCWLTQFSPSLIPRPLPDFISQPWRKICGEIVQDKIWKWPGDEANSALTAESFDCVWPNPGWEYMCLNTAVQQRVLPPVSADIVCLFHRYAKRNFTKNPDKYLKYSPNDLERTLQSFFDGGV